MTQYEYLKGKEEFCEEQVRKFARDLDMRVFWINSAKNYRERALALTLEEAAREYEEVAHSLHAI